MRNMKYWLLSTLLFTCTAASSVQADEFAFKANPSASSQLRIGVVNSKRCLEESKLGKEEQANFEKMKKQMESVLHDKESDLEEVDSKLDDDDYMDSISEEAASELKRKKRQIRNEGMQLQNQYMQTLQKINLEIIKQLTEAMNQASAQIAGDAASAQRYDAIFTDEAFTFYQPALDVSDQVIVKMDEAFENNKAEKGKKKELSKTKNNF